MKKLSLRLESLDVQSFPVAEMAEAARGTVLGAEGVREDSSFGSAIAFTDCTCTCQWTA